MSSMFVDIIKVFIL